MKLQLTELEETKINKDSEPEVKEVTFPYNKSKSIARFRASYWSEVLNTSSRTERRLFKLLRGFIIGQIIINLALLILFLIKNNNISVLITLLLSTLKGLFGILSSRINDKKYLGILSFLILLWESWATFHITLLFYHNTESSLILLVNGIIDNGDQILLYSIIILYGIHCIFSVCLISFILVWYLSPSYNNSSWDINPNTNKEKTNIIKNNNSSISNSATPIISISQNEQKKLEIVDIQRKSDVPTVLLDQRLNQINPKSFEASPIFRNLDQDDDDHLDPYINNLRYQYKIELLKRYSAPLGSNLTTQPSNIRWTTTYSGVEKVDDEFKA